MESIKNRVLEHLLTYTKIHTTSDDTAAANGVFPSTPGQKDLADLLVRELHDAGLPAECDSRLYIIASLPATPGYEKKPGVMFSAHMDTSGEVPGENVQPVLHRNYNGAPIAFSGCAEVLDPAVCKELAACAGTGDTIITSDGTTLLGGDDKAGIAAIMTAVEYIAAHPEIPHGPVQVMFSPDEETGHGMDYVPLQKITAEAAYTVDGGEAGEIEAECFNASRADITCTGVPMHLGYARGKLKNAVTMAADFISLLPRDESPETTDGYGGYYCPLEITGGTETAHITVFLRDFEQDGITRRTNVLQQIAKMVETRFPGGTVEVRVEKQYLNMKQKISETPKVMELLKKAVERAGCKPVMKPIRGGTDGSRLTELGLPTPNIFTGGHNFHSRTEWVSLNQLAASCRTIIELITLYGEE